MWRLASAIVLASIAVAAAQQPELPDGPAAQIVQTRCLTCHGSDLIVQQRLQRDGWMREVDKMIGWGVVLTEPEKTAAVDYLAQHFGPEAAGSRESAGDALLKSRCVACHDRALIDQQRLDVAGWRRELDKMIGWGAVLTPAERDELAAHLAGRVQASR